MGNRVECRDCDWQGRADKLINSACFDEDYYVDGEECPKCNSNNIVDLFMETEEE